MKKKNDDSSSRTLTVGSLFAGIGGFELGFEATGRFETLWQVERDEYASRVLAKHWPNVLRHDDVCTWPNETTEPVDVLLAGFPCQDISYAGKGAGLNGKRSGLFYEVMRIVREMGPRYIVLENVSALLTRGMGDVLGTLAALGYDAEWEIVSAASVGAPHRRDRVFIIGWNTGESCDVSNAKHDGPHRNRKNEQKREREKMGRDKFIRRHGSNGDLADTDGERGAAGIPEATGRQKSIAAIIIDESRRRGGRQGENEGPTLGALGRVADGFSLWLDEPRIGRTAVGVVKRADRLRCLGNAIVPQVAKVVAERVLQIDDERRGV